MARHPTMRTLNGTWIVEVITTRGAQSFRVKNLHSISTSTTGSTGQTLTTVAELRTIMGDDYDQLVEDRSGRFDGGR